MVVRLTNSDRLKVRGVIWVTRSLVLRKDRIRIDRASERYMCLPVEGEVQEVRCRVTDVRNVRPDHYVGGGPLLDPRLQVAQVVDSESPGAARAVVHARYHEQPKKILCGRATAHELLNGFIVVNGVGRDI